MRARACICNVRLKAWLETNEGQLSIFFGTVMRNSLNRNKKGVRDYEGCSDDAAVGSFVDAAGYTPGPGAAGR